MDILGGGGLFSQPQMGREIVWELCPFLVTEPSF